MKIKITRKVLTEKYSVNSDIEGLFLSFLDGCKLKLSKEHEFWQFYGKGNEVLFEHDLKHDIFYIEITIWKKFERKINTTKQQMQHCFYKVLNEKIVGNRFKNSIINYSAFTKIKGLRVVKKRKIFA